MLNLLINYLSDKISIGWKTCPLHQFSSLSRTLCVAFWKKLNYIAFK